MARFANLTVETWDIIGALPPRASSSGIVIEMFLREADLLPMLQAAVPSGAGRILSEVEGRRTRILPTCER